MSTATEKKKTKNPNEFILKRVRLSFPHIFTPKAIGDGKPRYTASFLLDPKNAEHKELILAMRAKVNQLFAEGVKKADAKPKPANCCLKKGNDEDGTPLYDGYDNMYVVNSARAESQDAPLVVDGKKNKLEKGSKIPYAGCYVNAKVRFYFSDYDGVKRITSSLEVVQFVAHGEPFGNGAVDADDMPDEEDADGLDDSGTGDDEDDL